MEAKSVRGARTRDACIAAGRRRLWGPKDGMQTVALAISSAQASFAARGEGVDAGEALARMADHFVMVWEEAVKRRKVPKKRREILERTGGTCAWPGCTRKIEHLHHLEPRSRGGSDKVTNQAGFCVPHHLRGIHEGYFVVTGRAGERIVFRRRGAGGSRKEVRVVAGDDDATRLV